VMESLVPDYDGNNHIRERSGSKLKGIAPSNVYRCKDGDYMIGANQDAIFGRLASAMGQPGLAGDPRYATHVARGIHQDELDVLIEAWTAGYTMDELETMMVEHSIPAGRIYRAPEMIADPHFAARAAIVKVETGKGPLRMQNAFPKFSETPSGIRAPAPAVIGQDNGAVYGALLGLDAEDLRTLAERKVI
jgi:crotonobetainyl-CoA:carnitine CoA-transferase CaiB-like acyl-CoA transferase